jgi:hypothetical protein
MSPDGTDQCNLAGPKARRQGSCSKTVHHFSSKSKLESLRGNADLYRGSRKEAVWSDHASDLDQYPEEATKAQQA